MSESSTVALVWLYDNDPDLLELHPVDRAARLIVETAIPMRWGTADVRGIERAATAITRDPGYRRDVFADAQARIDHERGSYALLGERLMAARRLLNKDTDHG